MNKPPVKEKIINLQGYPLTFKESGQGQPLIFIHTTHLYAKYFANLQSNKYKIITLDIPGYYHYGQQKKPITSIDLFVDLMADFFQKLNFTKVDLIGECLGTTIVAKFALEYPQQVKRLILICPPLKVNQPKLSLFFDHLAKSPFWGKLAKALIIYPNPIVGLLKTLFGYGSLSQKGTYLLFQKNFDQRVFFGILADFFKIDQVKILKQVKTKTLIIAGKKDLFNDEVKIKNICQQKKNFTCANLAEADHRLIDKQTENFHQIVSKFLPH